MSNDVFLKLAATPHFTLELDKEDGTEPTKWHLCYTYRAIAKIQDAIGKDIKKFEDWKDLSSGKDFPVIVWGGLDKFNPSVTVDEVIDILNPEAQRLLSDKIFELLFPGVVEIYQKALAEQKDAGATADPLDATGTTTV